MKNQLYIYLFFSIFSFFFACSDGNELAPGKKSTDTETLLNHYWDLFDVHYEPNPDSALYYMQEVITLAEASNKTKWIAPAYGAIADIKYKQGYLKEAAFHYLEAATRFKKAERLPELANVYNSIGDIFVIASDYKTAIYYFSQAGDIYFYEGNSRKKAIVFRNLAYCYIQMNQFREAETELENARQAAMKAQEFDILSLIYNTWGAANFKEKRYDEARENYQLAIQYADTLSEGYHTKASAINNIGETYLKEGNYLLAEEWLNRSLAVKTKINDPYFTQSTLNIMGKLMIEQGKGEAGIALIEEGLQRIDMTVVDKSVGEGLSLISEALVKFSQKEDRPKNSYLIKQFATYNQKLVVYNNLILDLREELETTSKQQALWLATEKHTMGTKLEAAKEKNEEIKLAFLIPIFFLACSIVAIVLVIQKNRKYKTMYSKIENILNNTKLLQHLR